MAFNLPYALARLRDTGRLTPADDWGTHAHDADSYAEFAEGWIGPSPVPTEAELLTAWDWVRANTFRPKTETELIATVQTLSPANLTTFLAHEVVKRRLIFLLLQRFPDLGTAAGFPISGVTLQFPD